ncbi:hypothetical protein D7Y27_22500 [Corallococcus sp. AB004]|nr:hypothetical protein D7Y27_22500 [Corallococcus sp. AB004]
MPIGSPLPKPSKVPRWATTAPTVEQLSQQGIVEPNEGKKDTGWLLGDRPPAQHFNWFWNLVGRWLAYLDDFPNQEVTWRGKQSFGAAVDFVAGNAVRFLEGASFLKSLALSAAGDTVEDLRFDVVPGMHKLRVVLELGGGMRARVYSNAGTHSLAVNAAWNGSAWVADVPGTASYRASLSSAGLVLHAYTAPDTAPFTEATFATRASAVTAGGTKGQVLGYTADNAAAFTNTLRYGEVFITPTGTPALQGIFAGQGLSGLHIYRSVTGYAGMGGLVGVNFSSASSSSQNMLVLPDNPINFRPSHSVGQPVYAKTPSGALLTVLLTVSPAGQVAVEGLASSSGTGQLMVDGVMWRAA